MLSFWKVLKGLIPTWLADLIPSKKRSTKESPSEPLEAKDMPPKLSPLPSPPTPRPLPQPLSVELKLPTPEAIELRYSWPIAIELKTPTPEAIELRYSWPMTIELRTPPVMETIPVLDWLASIPEIVTTLSPTETSSISPDSERLENPTSETFWPGLTTQPPELESPSENSETQIHSLPMAVGMPIPMMASENGAAMSPKKTKSESETVREATATDESPEISVDLESAASEWNADPIATGFTAETSTPSEQDESVSLILDPASTAYGISSVSDIAAAQATDEELELDEPRDEETEFLAPLELADNEAEIEETLERLTAKMKAEEAETARDLAEATAITEENAKKLLADQIAEDEALSREMEAEAEDELDPELLAALPREPEEDDQGNLDLREMESCIEALLFMSERPMSAKKLQELLGPDMSLHYFQEALTNLQTRYAKLFHGFELVEIAHGYQFRTKVARAPLAKKLAKIQTQRLSTGAMESLAIIAYKQPVMKDDIDKIRGVDSSHFIRGLLDKKLIKITGRSELPGRPMLYATTTEFLEVFGLKSLDAMPALKELESMVPGSQSGNPDDGDPRVKKMRELVSQMNSDESVSLLYNAKDDEAFLTEIRDRVKSIEITTPTLQAQADEVEAEKQATKARAKAIADGTLDPQAESFADAANRAAPGETAEMPID